MSEKTPRAASGVRSEPHPGARPPPAAHQYPNSQTMKVAILLNSHHISRVLLARALTRADRIPQLDRLRDEPRRERIGRHRLHFSA